MESILGCPELLLMIVEKLEPSSWFSCLLTCHTLYSLFDERTWRNLLHCHCPLLLSLSVTKRHFRLLRYELLQPFSIQCCREGDLSSLKLLQERYSLPFTRRHLFHAAKHGQQHIVKYLLPLLSRGEIRKTLWLGAKKEFLNIHHPSPTFRIIIAAYPLPMEEKTHLGRLYWEIREERERAQGLAEKTGFASFSRYTKYIQRHLGYPVCNSYSFLASLVLSSSSTPQKDAVSGMAGEELVCRLLQEGSEKRACRATPEWNEETNVRSNGKRLLRLAWREGMIKAVEWKEALMRCISAASLPSESKWWERVVRLLGPGESLNVSMAYGEIPVDILTSLPQDQLIKVGVRAVQLASLPLLQRILILAPSLREVIHRKRKGYSPHLAEVLAMSKSVE